MFKTILVLPVAILASCGSVKNSDAQSDSQLMVDISTVASDAYQGRKTGTEGSKLARSYISARFERIGLKPFSKEGYSEGFEFKTSGGETVLGTNIVGYIQGNTDDAIVISAHYDHLGIRNQEIYNGADDNASGVAGLLYLADYFARNKPEHTLIFAAFDAEEMGLQGAKAFVAHPPVDRNRIRLNVNMDMISHNDKNELYVCGTYKYPELKKYVVTNTPNPKVLFGHDDPNSGQEDWTNQSDQGAFNAVNIPFLYFGVEDHPDYHKPSDQVKNINEKFFTDAVDAIRQILVNIDKERDMKRIFNERIRMKKQ